MLWTLKLLINGKKSISIKDFKEAAWFTHHIYLKILEMIFYAYNKLLHLFSNKNFKILCMSFSFNFLHGSFS